MFEFPPVNIEIKPSKIIKGEVGLFSVRNLKKGIIIADDAQFKVKYFLWSDVRLDKITKVKIKAFCQTTKDGFFAPANLNYLSIVWFMNHSCSPNIGVNDAGDFVTMRFVRKGEELVWDYAFGEIDSDIKMKCLCGSKRCRGILTGWDWRRPELLKKYFQYFMPNLKKEILRMQNNNKKLIK